MGAANKSNSKMMPNLGNYPAKDADKLIKQIDLLVGTAFPAASLAIKRPIALALYIKQAIEWANWALAHNPKEDINEGINFALKALYYAADARNYAFAVFNSNDVNKAPIIGFVAPDGNIVGTANSFVDYTNDTVQVQDLSAKARNEILEHLPELECAFVTLADGNSSALTVEGWREFCKFIDRLDAAAVKTAIAALQLFLDLKEKPNED